MKFLRRNKVKMMKEIMLTLNKSIDIKELPLTESLKDIIHRVVPYFNNVILPEIKKGKNVLVVVHGNSMRALVKYLDNMSDEDIFDVDIPNDIPLIYEFNENCKVVKHYYLKN